MRLGAPRAQASSSRCCRTASLAAVIVFAGDAVGSVGGPPLVTEGPGTPGPGAWEINLAAVLEDSEASRLVAAPVLDLNYGWGERVQLKLEIPWLEERADGAVEDGLGSWEIGVKWRFLESANGRLRASIYPQAELDAPGTARAFEGEKAFVLPVQVAVSWALLDVSGELGYALHEDGPDEWLAGIAATRSLHERASLVAEFYARRKEDEPDRGQEFAAINLGLVLGIAKEANVLMSVGRALRRGESAGPRLSAYLGLQVVR